jgi:hypothetical protein
MGGYNMARVRKCDRCGKYYEPKHDLTPVLGITSFNMDNEMVGNEDYKDLCPECKESFDTWLNEIGYNDIIDDLLGDKNE